MVFPKPTLRHAHNQHQIFPILSEPRLTQTRPSLDSTECSTKCLTFPWSCLLSFHPHVLASTPSIRPGRHVAQTTTPQQARPCPCPNNLLIHLSEQARSEQRSLRAGRIWFRGCGPVGRGRPLRDNHVRPKCSGPGWDKMDGLGTGKFPGVQVRGVWMNRSS